MEQRDDDLECSFGDDEFGLGNSTLNSVNLDTTCETSFELDPDDPGHIPSTSTPTKSCFKKPKPPPGNYFKKCTLCGRFIKTERGFQTHQQTHRWKDAAALKPPVKELIAICESKVPEIIDRIISEFTAGEGQPGHLLAVEVEAALGDLKANVGNSEFLSQVLRCFEEMLSLKSGTKTMPSALRPLLQCELSALYSKQETVKKLMDSFSSVTKASPAVSSNVIFMFMKKVMDTIFVSMCEKIRGPVCGSVRVKSKDDFNHYLSQQVVHYVSGSCLRAHFRNAHTHPKNNFMRNVKDCILEKFATVGGPSVLDRKNPQYWTSVINRKSLLFVRESALPFFIEVSKLLQSLESADGSLHHEKVMSALTATPAIISLWDSIVENFLPDEYSFRFMMLVIRSLTHTFGKGIMLRRMNAKARTGKGNKTALAPSMRARLIGKQ